jgi:hypothetical protein
MSGEEVALVPLLGEALGSGQTPHDGGSLVSAPGFGLESPSDSAFPTVFDTFQDLDDAMQRVCSDGNFRLRRKHHKRPKTDNFVRGTYNCSGPVLDAGQKPWVVCLVLPPC